MLAVSPMISARRRKGVPYSRNELLMGRCVATAVLPSGMEDDVDLKNATQVLRPTAKPIASNQVCLRRTINVSPFVDKPCASAPKVSAERSARLLPNLVSSKNPVESAKHRVLSAEIWKDAVFLVHRVLPNPGV